MSDLTVQQAHKNFEKIIILVKDISQRWLFLGQLLWENREKGYWEKLGHESFNSFLAAPELGLSPTTHYKFIHLYELYCLKLGFDPKDLVDISYERLMIIKDKISPTNKENWISKAKSLSQSDLMIEVKEHEQNVGFKVKKDYPQFYRHAECGKWKIEVDPLETCMCYLKEVGL